MSIALRSADAAAPKVDLPKADLATKKESPDAKKRAEAAKAGRDFEAILVRQLLAQTNIAGKGGGYGDMAVEALATSVTSAGGMGLGRAIEEALAPHAHRESTREIPKKTPDSAPQKK